MNAFRKLARGRALYVTPDVIWMSRGMSFFGIDSSGKRVTSQYRVGGFAERMLASSRLIRHGLRLGIHHLLPLADGNLLVTAKRRTYVVAPDGGVVSEFRGYQGNKPGHQGVCITPDGTVFFGEYILNGDRSKAVSLYRSTDNGRSFHVVKRFAPGEIRHIHFVKWDPYARCLWLGTGDYGADNSENRLYRSLDNGDSWQLIGSGSQDWRAIGVCFTPTHLMWGTDAGSCPDTVHLIRMERDTCRLEILEDMEGPCHGCATLADGRICFSTGVEGGENEKDCNARLKVFDNTGARTLYSLPKDHWPLLVQFGVMRFPLGSETCNRIVFTAMGLKGHGETVMIEKMQ